MGNQLNEFEPVVREQGLDTNVIAKQLPVEKDASLDLLIKGLHVVGVVLAVYGLFAKEYILALAGAGLFYYVFSTLKKTESYFQQLQQQIQTFASEIDVYQAKRVQILKNVAAIVEKAVDLDKSTFEKIAALRSNNHGQADDAKAVEEFAEMQAKLDAAARSIHIAVENYPDLKAHGSLRDAMRQNDETQSEITAARSLYNDAVSKWNRDIFDWPFKKYVAAKNHYTTRVPFIASKEIKEESQSVFF